MAVALRAAESGPVAIGGYQLCITWRRISRRLRRWRLSFPEKPVFSGFAPPPTALGRKIAGYAIESQEREIAPRQDTGQSNRCPANLARQGISRHRRQNDSRDSHWQRIEP